jgi:hypothetical protein
MFCKPGLECYCTLHDTLENNTQHIARRSEKNKKSIFFPPRATKTAEEGSLAVSREERCSSIASVLRGAKYHHRLGKKTGAKLQHCALCTAIAPLSVDAGASQSRAPFSHLVEAKVAWQPDAIGAPYRTSRFALPLGSSPCSIIMK